MRRTLTLSVLTAVGLSVAAYAAFGPGRLTIGDKTIETNFIVQDGHTYVKLADVADALNCVVQKSDGGFTLAPVGKGNMVQGNEGKIGQTIGVPQMQFTVTGMSQADHYDRKYGEGAIGAYDSKMTLVILACRVRNGTGKTVNICTLGGAKTALTDMDEHSYEVLTGDGPRNVDILPGAVTDFAIAFKVPKAEKTKSLVYQTDGFPKVEIFRVSLADSQ